MKFSAGIRLRGLIPALLSAMLIAAAASGITTRIGHADVPVAASAGEIQPLAAGDPAPRFAVREIDGTLFRFDPAALDNPAIIVTFRGGWCPYCNMHLSELRHVIPAIGDLGIDILFLSGDRPDQLYRSLDPGTQQDIDGLGYRLLSDANAHAAIALGIAFRASDTTVARRAEKGDDIEGSSMDRHQVLPVPAVFAIDADGTIRYVYTNADYKVRLPAEKLLEVARRLASG